MSIHNVAGFDWNHGNLKKCQKHGVEIAEIESVFRQTMAVFPDPAHSQGEDRFIDPTRQKRIYCLYLAHS